MPGSIKGKSLDQWRGEQETTLRLVKESVDKLVDGRREDAESRNKIEKEVTKLSTKISIYVPIIAFLCSGVTSVIVGVMVALFIAWTKMKG